MIPRPRNAAELLIEAKDLSELMVDLAYASVYFHDVKLAEEIGGLRRTLTEYLRDLRRECILASRSPEDAKLMTAVVLVSDAIEDIGHAATDIARVVLVDLGIPEDLRRDLAHAEEIVGRVRVREGAACVGRTLGDLHLPKETQMWIIAVRRGDEWRLDPDAATILSAGDVLLFRGPEEGMNRLRALVGASARPAPPTSRRPAFTDLDRAVDLLVEMKNGAEAAVGLAYSALALGDASLAAEVGALEVGSNRIRDELESWVLRAAMEARDAADLRGLIRLAAVTESIFDAARKLSGIVGRGEQMHPVVQLALEETDEVVAEESVEVGSSLVGCPVAQLEAETGVSVLGVQRRGRWWYRPHATFQLAAEDRIIATGSVEGASELVALASSESGQRPTRGSP